MDAEPFGEPQLPAGWVLIDIELLRDRTSIRELAFVDNTGGEKSKNPDRARLNEILERVEQAEVIVGHNVRLHDLPELYRLAARPFARDLPERQFPRELDSKICDTLELSTLFLVGKPTHKLSKQYKEEHELSDPLEDAWESYRVYQQIANLEPLPKLVRHWACRLLPKGYPLITKTTTSLEQKEWEQLKRQHPLLEIQSLRQYLKNLQQRAPNNLNNLGAVVFLNWLYQLSQRQSRRPAWIERQTHFSTFHEAEKCALPHLNTESLTQELQYFFGPDYQFREGQLEIIQGLLQGEFIPLGLLPTGGGKSLTFQLPALIFSRYYRGLSVIISPLQALMQDQVQNLRNNVPEYAERVDLLSGMQTLNAQKRILEAVWQGEIDILYLSPERLRQPTIQRILKHRLPHLWVLDEAHTLSQWGHDFRPDFFRLARVIQELYQGQHSPRWGFVTATATHKVIKDLTERFEQPAAVPEDSDAKHSHSDGRPDGRRLRQLPANGETFRWRPEIKTHIEIVERPQSLDEIATSARFKKVVEYLNHLERRGAGKVAIVYVPTRRMAERYAKELQAHPYQFRAAAFHSRISSSDKQAIIQRFKEGSLEVVVATNAFGMGIDRAGILTVIHVAPSATPEAYLQEIGRAARNPGEQGVTYLFLDEEKDFGWIFEQEINSRISIQALRSCWDVIRPLLRRGNDETWVGTLDFAQSLVQEDLDVLATQVRVVLHYLEEAELIREEESCPCLLNLSLKHELTEGLAGQREAQNPQDTLKQYLWEHGIRRVGKSVQLDVREISLATALSPPEVIKTIRDWVNSGAASWEYKLSFKFNFKSAAKLDAKLSHLQAHTQILLDWLNEETPELDEQRSLLLLKPLEEKLQQRDRHFRLNAMLRVFVRLRLVRWKKENNGSVRLFLLQCEMLSQWLKEARGVLQSLWRDLAIVKQRLYSVFAENKWTFGESQILNIANLENPRLLEELGSRDVLDLLEQMQCLNLITLGRGALSAVTLHRLKVGERLRWSEQVYHPLEKHYEQRGQRIYALRRILTAGQTRTHEMIWDDMANLSTSEFEQRYGGQGLSYEQILQDQFDLPAKDFEHKYTERVQEASRIQVLREYFTLTLEAFNQKYLQDVQESEDGFLSPPKIDALLQNLNQAQKQIVKDEKSRALLVLAGPGSGKTHTIVHRIAYLILAKGIPPERILVVAYNRSAAAELRKRLYEQLGVQGRGVDALTFHALAAKLTGLRSGDMPPETPREERYDWLLKQAIEHLRENHPGYQYILIDEYQDVDLLKYEFIRELAAFNAEDEEQKSFLVAVGDDDQNLCEFQGASNEFIRRFTQDYGISDQEKRYLLENYRSGSAIVDFTNQFIEQAIPQTQRLKRREHRTQPIKSESGRIQWGQYSHAYHASEWMAQQIERLQLQEESLKLEEIAVLSHRWDDLRYLQHCLRERGIDYQFYSTKDDLSPARSYLGQKILERLWQEIAQEGPAGDKIQIANLQEYLEKLRQELELNDQDAAWKALMHAIGDSSDICKEELIDLLEAARPLKSGGIILSTFHSAKGSEFKHVFILEEGDFLDAGRSSDSSARKLYVGFTRAVERLYLLFKNERNGQDPAHIAISILRTIGNPNVQAITIPQAELPSHITYKWLLEPKDLHLSHGNVINDRGRQCVSAYAHRWGELRLRSDDGELSWRGRTVNGEILSGVVAVFSRRGRETLQRYRSHQIVAKGHTVFRVERDERWCLRPEDHHYVVLPCLEVKEAVGDSFDQ